MIDFFLLHRFKKLNNAYVKGDIYHVLWKTQYCQDINSLVTGIKRIQGLLPVKIEAQADTLRLIAKPQKESQITSKQKIPRTVRKSNCMEVLQPRI